jgi:hypothetical protein
VAGAAWQRDLVFGAGAGRVCLGLGGFTVRTYSAEAVDAVLLEHKFAGLRDTKKNRAAYADTFAKAVQMFFQRHYSEIDEVMDLPESWNATIDF